MPSPDKWRQERPTLTWSKQTTRPPSPKSSWPHSSVASNDGDLLYCGIRAYPRKTAKMQSWTTDWITEPTVDQIKQAVTFTYQSAQILSWIQWNNIIQMNKISMLKQVKSFFFYLACNPVCSNISVRTADEPRSWTNLCPQPSLHCTGAAKTSMSHHFTKKLPFTWLRLHIQCEPVEMFRRSHGICSTPLQWGLCATDEAGKRYNVLGGKVTISMWVYHAVSNF